jgi:hypothetical protein
MPGGLGLRFVAEAIFLVIVAAIAVIADFEWPAIILVMAFAWVLVSAVEWGLSRRTAAPSAEPAVNDADPTGDAEIPQHVRVLAAAEPPPPAEAPAPPVVAVVVEPEPEPEPEPVAVVVVVEPEPVPDPVRAERAVPTPAPPKRAPKPPKLAAAPEPKPPPKPPTLVPEPKPPTLAPPPPAPVPEPVPVPEPSTVVPITSRDVRPREWNLWELERLTREGGGQDRALDEERNYLLMYLREFANPDGALPVDFDGLVRDSFGDLIGAA